VISVLLCAALADGSTGGGAQRLVLTGPASAPAGSVVELELRGAWSGEAVLLSAPAAGGRVARPAALGGAVLELAQPIGVAAKVQHAGGVTTLRVRAPQAGSAAWQVVLVVGPARLSSNPVTVVAGAGPGVGVGGAVGALAGVGAAPASAGGVQAEVAPTGPQAPSGREPGVVPGVAPAVSPTVSPTGRVGRDTADTAVPP
jgi:hypothetical protein